MNVNLLNLARMFCAVSTCAFAVDAFLALGRGEPETALAHGIQFATAAYLLPK